MHHPYPRFRRWLGTTALGAGLLAAGLFSATTAQAQWIEQDTNFPSLSTGIGQIDVVSNNTVWATGYDGSLNGATFTDFTRTTNGGTTWVPGTVAPAAAGFGFSNLSAVSGTTAWAAMSDPMSGGGELFRTTNSGATWTRQLATGFTATGAWLNAVKMFSATSGVVMGDPVSGSTDFEVYTTANGTTWTAVPGASLPDAQTGEFGFGNVMEVQGTSNVWFGTSTGRVYRSTNGGTSWTAAATGLGQINHIAFASATNGLAMELDNTGVLVGVARTTNGGASWALIAPTGTVYTSDLAAVPGTTNTFVAAGARPGNTGSAYSSDGGLSWTDLETGVQRTTIGAANATAVWAGAFTDATTGAGGIFFGSLPVPPTPSTLNWTWARRLAGADDDVAACTATDAGGNVYVGGRFTGSITIGTTTLTSQGANDAYLAKYSPTGTVLWARRAGGTGQDFLSGMAVDQATGEVVVTGGFSGTATFGTFSLTSQGDYDLFVAKYSATGTPVWVKQGAGIGADYGSAVDIDNAGSIYVTGEFVDGLSFDNGAATFFGDGIDGFMLSLTTSGALRWSNVMNSLGDVSGSGIAVTQANGTVYATGGFNGEVFFDNAVSTLVSAGAADVYLVAHSAATGAFQWARRLGSTADDGGNSVDVDAAGNAYVAGYFTGTVTVGTQTLTSVGGTTDLLVAKYSAAGVAQWGRSGGGATGNDSGYEIVVSPAGTATVTGFLNGTSTFGTTTLTGVGLDVILASYSTAGVQQSADRIGGLGTDLGRGLALDAAGNLYVAGQFSTTLDFNAAGTLTSSTLTGTYDGFLAKLGSSCTLVAPTVTANGPLCAGQTLTLTAANVPAGTTLAWTGPNGFTATTNPVSIANATAAASGTYTLTATSAAQNCSVSATVTATVDAVPVAPTAAGTFSRCGSGTLALAVISTPGTTYQWYTTATGGTPISGATGALYTTPSLTATATYYVSALNSTGSCEGPRRAIVATVTPAPTISIAANGPLTFCDGGSVTLTASGAGTNGTYLWNTGASGASISVSAAGNYTATGTTVGGACSATSAATTVTVTATPAAPTATDNARCAPGTVTLTAAGTGAAYRWYTTATGGAPIAGATGATYTTPSLAATTTYYVSSSTAAVGGCESPRTAVTATINPLPTVALAAGGPTTFCDGGSVTLTATASAGATVQFLLNGGPVAGTTPTTLVATQSGQYTVTATTGAPCEATSAPVTVTVNPAATATFSFPANTICLGGAPTVTPTISGTAGGTFSASPTTGLNLNTTTGIITLAGSVAGTYAVSYSVGGQCPATASQIVTLTAAPTATFSYAAPSVCATAGTTSSPVAAPGSGLGTFSASPAGLSLNAATGVIDLGASAPGVYTIVNALAASGSCPAALATTSLTVLAAPATPTFTVTPQGALLLLTSSAPTGNQWYLNGGAIPGATDPTYLLTAAAQNGVYTVVTTLGTCVSAPSVGQNLTITGTTADAAAAAGLTLYPNPTADGRVALELNALPTATRLTILDGAGRAVLTTMLPAGTTRFALDAHALPAGVYAVRVGAAVRRLVRE